jgi:hypothetical protein
LGAGKSDMTDHPDEPPPFLGTWNRLYLAIILYLVVVITLFYFFTRTFNR